MPSDEFIMECPECGLNGEVPGWWEGMDVECKKCENVFEAMPK